MFVINRNLNAETFFHGREERNKTQNSRKMKTGSLISKILNLNRLL